MLTSLLQPLFTNPFYLFGNPSFTYLEIPPLCCGANSRPLLSQIGSKLNPPHPPHSPSPPSTFPPIQMHALLRRHYDIGFI